MNSFAVLNTVLSILAPLLSVGVAIVGKKVNDYFGLKEEKLVRDAIHASAENGLKLAMSKGIGSPDRMVETAIDYVLDKNPDGVNKSKLNRKDLGDIVRTKLPDTLARRSNEDVTPR